MITANILQRVFMIRRQYANEINAFSGTCFTIEVDNKQYVITARHLFDVNNPVIPSIYIKHESQWKLIDLNLVGHGKNNIDISVFSANTQLSPTLIAEPSMNGMILGQDVFFLGYPYELSSDITMSTYFPLPFVKKASVSCFMRLTEDGHIIFLDGINNPGFSGGPVVFAPIGTNNFQIVGVVSGYIPETQPVKSNLNGLLMSYQLNSGIILSYDIQHAIDIIKNNPIGFPI